MASTNTTPFHAEPIPTGVLDHLAARGREMRACTATTLSARYRDPVIRPSMDSMIFRNDFEKKTTSTDNTDHPRGTAQLHFFLRLWDTTLRDSSIAGNKPLCDSWLPRVPFTSRSLSIFFRVFLRSTAACNRGFRLNLVSSNSARRSSNIDLLFLLLSHCAISTDRSRL